MRETGHDNPVQVRDESFQRLRCFRGVGRQGVYNFSWRHARADWQAGDPGAVVGHPIDQFVAGAAEFFRSHGESLSRPFGRLHLAMLAAPFAGNGGGVGARRRCALRLKSSGHLLVAEGAHWATMTCW